MPRSRGRHPLRIDRYCGHCGRSPGNRRSPVRHASHEKTKHRGPAVTTIEADHRDGPAIETIALTKHFGSVVAVDNLSFTVPHGAVTGFVGGNGSGKTTTIRTLLGLTIPTAGQALVAGRPLADHKNPRSVVGAVLNRTGAHPGVSGRRHLALIATATGLPPERCDEVLELVGLADAADRKVGTYSTGMSQRLALATALLAEPEMLVLDEPSNGLDPAGIRWLRELLRARADAGAAVLVSTHQLAELATVVDHLIVLDAGRLIAAGPAPEVLNAAGAGSIEDLLLIATP
ncbi:MAG: ATP-binding cassette domain-containing protein [Actinomycetia bacterium]|nr:ATP-binding cassette domain-containing protein [Actinomycetes bacterium]